jgi:iron complex outermembrane recepter protein
MKNYILLLFLVFVSGFKTTIYAQDTISRKTSNNLFELNLDTLFNLVITPSKLPQSAEEVTQKVDVIDAKAIETNISGNRNVCEAISKLPGASVSVLSRNDANWGTYGGIGPKYSTYMLNGLPIDAFIDPMSLDLNAIDHIEVQRGPSSVLYPNYLSQDFAGNQSPLAGTVNLVLKEKITQPKTMAQTSYGTYNTLNGQVYHQNQIGLLNYFCGTSYEMSDYTNYGTDGSWLNMKKDPEYKKTKFYAGLTLFMDKSENQKLTLFYQKTFHSGDVGRVYRGFDYQYSTFNASYSATLTDKIQLQSHLGIRSYNRNWQESNYGVIDTLKSQNNVNQNIVPADISLSWIQSKKGSLSIGADYQAATYETWSDPLVGYHIYGNKASAIQGGAYAQEELDPIKGLKMRAGIRYAYIKNNVEIVNSGAPGDNSVFWKKALWSAGLRYSIKEKIAFYINGGSSFAVPSIKSSCGTILLSDLGIIGHNGQLPSPGLKPETGLGFDIGIEGLLPAHVKFGIRAFSINLKDAIVDNVVSHNPSQTQSFNAGSSTSNGGEIELNQKINTHVSWFTNFTYMVSKIKNNVDSTQNNIEIPFSPNAIVNIGLSYYSLFGFTFVPSLNFNSGFYDGTVKAERKKFTPGFVINAYVSQRITKTETYVVECFTQLYNITNNDYEMPWQFKNTGFSGMAGVKVTFK